MPIFGNGPGIGPAAASARWHGAAWVCWSTMRPVKVRDGALLGVFLSVDIVGSTRILATGGVDASIKASDKVAQAVSATCPEGQLLDRRGDGTLIGFTSAAEALRSSIDLQRWIGETDISVRVGIVCDQAQFDTNIFWAIEDRLEQISRRGQPGDVIVDDTTWRASRSVDGLTFETLSGPSEAESVRLHRLQFEVGGQAGRSVENATLRAVVFTDLVPTDATNVHEASAQARSISERCILGHDGIVVDTNGAGHVAVFDSCTRALDAAAQIHEEALSEELHHRRGTLPFAIGISIGDVVVRDEGPFGLAVVEAARLQAAADQSSTLASADVISIDSEERQTDPLGLVPLRGLPDPVMVERIAGNQVVRSPLPLPAAFIESSLFPLVGRSHQVEALEQIWAETMEGAVRMTLISGEEGVGSTRLIKELATKIHADGSIVLHGACLPDDPDPYGALNRAFAPAVALDRSAGLDPNYRDLIARLGQLAEHRPTVLVVEDIHWASPELLEVLQQLPSHKGDARFAVVVSCRANQLTDRNLLQRPGSAAGRVDHIRLERLRTEDVMSLLGSRLSVPMKSEERRAAQRIAEITGGSPLLIHHLLAHLVRDGALARDPERGWELRGDPAQFTVPATLIDVVWTRASNLDEDTKRTLAAAAYIGMEFNTGLLGAVMDRSAMELLEAIDRACASMLVLETDVDSFRFADEVTQTAFLRELRPSHRHDLEQRLAAAKEQQSIASNLPRVRTSFLGREREVEEVISYLDADHAAVTLLGPGGVGKTRLAVEGGTRIHRDQQLPVVFCDLAPIRDDSDVITVVADSIGARKQPGLSLIDSILDFLRNRRVLLVLDNCEQVVDVVRSIVNRLSQADQVSILTTSRTALRAPGEQLVDVSPLEPGKAGLDLFLSRAREYDSTFSLDGDDENIVRSITTRLDGIPLAIELAAARVRLLSPRELAAALAESIDVLGAHHHRGRAETLRDTIAWSYQMLTPAEMAVFCRMSVFGGGATLDAIGAVCSDDDLVASHSVPDIVLSLVEKSMLVGRTTHGHRRFGMLETMRTFGNEELDGSGARNEFRLRHAHHFAGVAATQGRRIFTEEEADAWRVLDDEWGNLRIAVDSLVTAGDIDTAIDLVTELVYYATFAMRLELFTWADELRERLKGFDHPRYGDLCGAAALGAYLSVSDRVSELAAEGMAATPPDPEGWCRVALAAVFLNNVHSEEESDSLTASWVESNPTTVGGRIWSQGFRAFHFATHFHYTEALPFAAATVQLADETNSISARALGDWANGMVVSFRDLDEAIRIWTEGRSGPRSLPRDHLVDHLLVGLVLHFTVAHHSIAEALHNCRAALQQAIDSHYYAGTSHLFGVTAIALCRADDPQTGARLFGAMNRSGHEPRRNAIKVLTAALGDNLDALKAEGSELSLTQAGHMALAALDRAIERLGRDQVDPAR